MRSLLKFRQAFSKACGFQRQRLWSAVATADTPLSVLTFARGELQNSPVDCFGRGDALSRASPSGRGRTPTPTEAPVRGLGGELRSPPIGDKVPEPPYALTYLFDCFLESLSLLDRQFAALLPLFFCEIGCFFILYYYCFVFV